MELVLRYLPEGLDWGWKEPIHSLSDTKELLTVPLSPTQMQLPWQAGPFLWNGTGNLHYAAVLTNSNFNTFHCSISSLCRTHCLKAKWIIWRQNVSWTARSIAQMEVLFFKSAEKIFSYFFFFRGPQLCPNRPGNTKFLKKIIRKCPKSNMSQLHMLGLGVVWGEL